MTREELIKAMDDSKEVRWKNDAYKCFKDKFGRYLVKCTLNDYTIGIFHKDGKGMNIDLDSCYIKKDLIEIPSEKYVELYSELATLVERKAFPDRKTHDDEGNRLDSTSDDFCEICEEVENILGDFFKKGDSIEPLTDEELSNLLTEEVCDYWLGDATNKQARINLFYECKHDPKVLESVLDHWRGVDQ